MVQMRTDENIRVLIVGAGTTGTDLFNTITDEPGVMLTGIVDRKNEFSSLDLACNRGIPVYKDISEAMRTMPDIVFHLTESNVPSSEILAHKAAHTEIIEDGGIRFFLIMIHQSRRQILSRVQQSGNLTDKRNREQDSESQKPNESPEKQFTGQATDTPDKKRGVERRNKTQNDFIAAVSHELRTPLNAILGFSELLCDDTASPLTDVQRRHVEHIRTSGDHLLQLTNNILDIARVEAGKTELKYETFPLQKIVSEVEAVIRPLADKKTLQFDIHVADGLPFIRADRTKLIQILYNLLSNAVKFTPQEGRIFLEIVTRNEASRHDGPSRLYCGPEATEAFLELRVSDTGIGIREEDRERIFDAFEQVSGSHDGNNEGTGLGLALTKKLVELHGGRISLESEYGQGSTFTVTIPLKNETASESAVSPTEGADTSEDDEGLFLHQKKQGALILLVEDDPATAELLAQFLNRAGFRTAHVFNGSEAVKRVRDLRPFAILLDIMLPGKDGWQVLLELKSDPDIRDIPVIILSVLDNQDLGSALGAADYLIKPVDRGALLGKLGKLGGIRGAEKKSLNILCIDGNDGVLEWLRETLETAGYHIITAKTGNEGMEKAVTFRPDLIISDLMFPDTDGFEFSRALKNNEATINIPIIVLTAKDINVEARLKLIGKIESTLRKSCLADEDLLAHIRDLEMTYPYRLGLLDTVSGLFDRSYFQIRLAQEICRADRYKTIFSILMADVDDFGRYIRANGIHNGNLCIRKIADFLRKTTRGSDTIVRYGRDEFALLLASATEEASRIVARRLRSFMESYRFPGQEHLRQGRLTASIAVVYYNRISPSSPEEMIAKTQELLREAKKSGGGNIRIYGQPLYTAEMMER